MSVFIPGYLDYDKVFKQVNMPENPPSTEEQVKCDSRW